MFVELENTAIVETQSFPDCIAALHRRIKRADPSLVAMHELPVDIHNQVAVSLVEFLQHFKSSFCHSERGEEPLMHRRNHTNKLTKQITCSKCTAATYQ